MGVEEGHPPSSALSPGLTFRSTFVLASSATPHPPPSHLPLNLRPRLVGFQREVQWRVRRERVHVTVHVVPESYVLFVWLLRLLWLLWLLWCNGYPVCVVVVGVFIPFFLTVHVTVHVVPESYVLFVRELAVFLGVSFGCPGVVRAISIV